MHSGVGLAEITEHGGQAVQADMMAGCQPQLSTHVAGQIAHGLLSCAQLLLYVFGMWQQGVAGFRQADVAANTIKQFSPQLLFQQRDAFTDCGLGQVQFFGCQGKRSTFCHQHESGEVLRIHYVFHLGIY